MLEQMAGLPIDLEGPVIVEGIGIEAIHTTPV